MGGQRATEENIAVSAARVASIVEHRAGPAFVLLLQLAGRHFADPGLERALAERLRETPG
jgi:hypothetical protein